MAPGALVLHGFTGTPASVAGLASALGGAGFEVASPLLPGHGGALEAMVGSGWPEWTAAADEAYRDLAGRTRPVVVAGLSLGGALACWLAAAHPEVAGVVCVNPVVEPAAESFHDILRGLLAGGVEVVPSAMAADVARPDSGEAGPGGAPVGPLLSLFEGVAELAPRLGAVACPLLLFTSARDHVVPTSASDFLAARVAGPVERVRLERSYHVATMDFDAPEIERRAASFAADVAQPAVAAVAGCLFEVALPGAGWRLVDPPAAVTVLGDRVGQGRQHVRLRAESPGAATLAFADGDGHAHHVRLRVAPEQLPTPRP